MNGSNADKQEVLHRNRGSGESMANDSSLSILDGGQRVDLLPCQPTTTFPSIPRKRQTLTAPVVPQQDSISQSRRLSVSHNHNLLVQKSPYQKVSKPRHFTFNPPSPRNRYAMRDLDVEKFRRMNWAELHSAAKQRRIDPRSILLNHEALAQIMEHDMEKMESELERREKVGWSRDPGGRRLEDAKAHVAKNRGAVNNAKREAKAAYLDQQSEIIAREMLYGKKDLEIWKIPLGTESENEGRYLGSTRVQMLRSNPR